MSQIVEGISEMESRDSHVGLEMAWHKLTKVVDRIDNNNCGICYDMELKPIYAILDDKQHELPGYQIAVSLDDNLPIGNIVSDRYTLISNRDIWNAVNEALGFTAHEIVSVGTLGNRERGYISIKLTEDFVAAGRKTQSVLNILFGHGGIMPVIAKSCFTVVVCANTFARSLKKNGEFSFRTIHKGDAQLKLSNMKEAIEGHLHSNNEFMESMEKMHSEALPPVDAEALFTGFLTFGDNELSSITDSKVDQVLNLFYMGAGNSGKTVADAFNALTDYYTHYSNGGMKKVEKQLESSEFGTAAQRKNAAFTILSGGAIPGFGDLDSLIEKGKVLVESRSN